MLSNGSNPSFKKNKPIHIDGIYYSNFAFAKGYVYLLLSNQIFNMILKSNIAALLLLSLLLFTSCGGKDDKKINQKTTPETTTIAPVETKEEGIVPVIDVATLKDEASLLSAYEKVIDARIADTKRKKEDPTYQGHLMELMKLHTDVIVASNTYYKSIPDHTKALEYGKKFEAIKNRLHTEN